jgi:hypothetical protein
MAAVLSAALVRKAIVTTGLTLRSRTIRSMKSLFYLSALFIPVLLWIWLVETLEWLYGTIHKLIQKVLRAREKRSSKDPKVLPQRPTAHRSAR